MIRKKLRFVLNPGSLTSVESLRSLYGIPRFMILNSMVGVSKKKYDIIQLYELESGNYELPEKLKNRIELEIKEKKSYAK